MAKPFTVNEKDIKHWVMPEVSGHIVGVKASDQKKPQTVEEIQALQKQAYDEGFKKGYDDGLKKGLAEMQAKAKQLSTLFSFVGKPLQQFDADLEKQLSELVLAISKLLLKKECSTRVEHIQALMHLALLYLPANARNVRIKLNPSDVALLTQAGETLKTDEYQCLADKTITQGGCMIDSDTSQIDATLENQLQQIFDQLTEHRPAPQPE